ncbi:MAG TPA: phosphotransferase family protein [Chitinophagales bacterium]|nr:phosphotransferase family protein [Chitinophagales bacterium]
MAEMQIDNALAPRNGEELDINILNAHLRENEPQLGTVTEILQFPGGFSNLTYCLKTTTGEYVLRRPPFGANIKSAHDMGREFKVLTLLKGVYNKIPNPVYYCESPEVMGAPFYIMQRIKGVILRAANAPKMGLAPRILQTASETLIDNLVALHNLDINSSGLIELGKPDGYVQRQIEGWIKRYYAAETDKIETLDAAAKWLQQNQPQSPAPAFIHNDYKFDNVIFSADNFSQIVGVLDWEMATVGDPLMDLGASLAYWSEPTDPDEIKFFNLTWLPGNLNKQQVIERYAAKSGRNLSNILFYYIFGLFKNAVIVQQIYARYKKGLTHDKRFAALLPVIKALGNKTAQTLNAGGI